VKTTYSFSVLRYMHDPVTQEFVNVGVAVYAPDSQYLGAKCSPHYGRITRMFDKIDGNRFKQLTRFVEEKLEELGASLVEAVLPFDNQNTHIPDDSALQFSQPGVGMTTDPHKTLSDLYDRYVERYTERGDRQRRTEEEVWRVFRGPMERRFVTAYLTPKTISAPDYQYVFERAFKNGVWHVCEPISFDLLEADCIVEKAIRWQGRLSNLVESTEEFQISLLLGAPQDQALSAAFQKAQKIIRKVQHKMELVQETEAEAFAVEVESQIRSHELETPR